jgi:PAS domain S-box-containing protein
MDRPVSTPADNDAALLDAAPVALLHVGADGALLRANAAARELLGDGAEPGTPIEALWAAGSAPPVMCDPGMAAGAVAEVDLALRGPLPRPVQARSRRLPDGGWMLALQPVIGPDPNGLASQLAVAVELGNVAIWRHDLATGRLYFNAQGYRVFGILPRHGGVPLEELRALTHPEDLPTVLASAHAALTSEGPTDIEARYRRGDGSWRHVMARRVTQRAPDGQPLAFVGVALDVTERVGQTRRAEELARRFELATRTAGIGYWLLEEGAERASLSPELRALIELPPDMPPPPMDQWLARFVHPDDRHDVRQRFAHWVRGNDESLAQTMRIVLADGTVRHIVSHSRKESGTAARGLFGVVIDLTERRRAELALRSAAESAALAARGAGLGTWEQDLHTGEARWDAQMWVLRGHAPQSRAMTEAERRACVHPEDRETFSHVLAEAVANGTPVEHEFRVVWPDGSVRWLASRSLELLDEVSGQRRRIGVNWDVTDSRNADAARQAGEIARRESEAKSKFLARMSHELRTPLNAVLGFSQLLLADEREGDAGAAGRQRRLQHIRMAGQHLLSLINDVLDLSSLEGGELRIALQPVALAPLVAQALPLLGPLRDDHRVQLRTGALDATVMADATRLRQVLINLLSNAIKYNREGGEVLVEARSEGTQVCLRVADTGPGMNAEQLAQLFEPFNRLGRETSAAVEGTGIGLAIVKALVEHMGGSIRVQSSEGFGSVFEIRLGAAGVDARTLAAPAASASGDATAIPRTAAAPSGRQHRVLYIEDNPVNAMIIAELLAPRSDLTLQVAVDGASGLAKASALAPDLILLDMQLPDMDGFEVLRRLRAQPATAGIPCVALSANAMPEDIRRALQAGMADYWTKPLDFRVFTGALDALLGKTR